ncbi:SLOG family protein [[Kitasatospora] papulosa]|uniref:SLOG family protein n=1 Tax=[Kitasatospora] papulosa TaxID=1464011 RepID=UPI00403D4E0C
MNPYRILVTGSRDWQDIGVVRRALTEVLAVRPHDQPIIVVHGDCPTGADIMAKVWTLDYETVTEEPHPAAWHLHGRKAGPLRNQHMVTKGADVCLAFIRNSSRGATGCANLAKAAGIPVRRWTA